MGGNLSKSAIVSSSIEAQIERAILNIKAVVEAAGSSLDRIISRRICITDLGEFRKVYAVWAQCFEEPYPVSTRVHIAGLAKEEARV